MPWRDGKRVCAITVVATPERRAASASVQVPGVIARSFDRTPWFVGQRPVHRLQADAALLGEGARKRVTDAARRLSASSSGWSGSPAGQVSAVMTINDARARPVSSGTSGASPKTRHARTTGPVTTSSASARRARRSFTVYSFPVMAIQRSFNTVV